MSNLTRQVLACTLAASFFAGSSAWADTSTALPLTALVTPVSQDFDSLVNTGTGTLAANTPAGFGFFETGTNANASYGAGTGSATTGDTLSFGAALSTERALGALQSGNLVPTLGARFVNNTGATLTSLDISYTGEQWRLGAPARADRLDFQYSLTATALNSTTYIDFDGLDFAAPISAGTAGALDGNAAANRTLKTGSITGLSIAPGGEIWLRWRDLDATGADDGLAIDGFSITAQGGAPVDTAPTITYNPATGALLFPGGSLASISTRSIAVTPAGGSGSGAAATTTINNCAITGAGAAAFGAVTGLPISFVGPVSAPRNIDLSCTIAAAAASATLSCDETTGAAAAVQRSWSLSCPAASAGGFTPISQVQGTGLTSPLTGTITIQGIVTARKSNGYIVQSRDVDADADPLSSEGILVFTNTAPPAGAVVGALVQITGTVLEFIPSQDLNQPPTTELVAPFTFVQVSVSNPLPAVIALPAVSASSGVNQLERFEHMRVSTGNLVVVAPTAGFVTEASATASSSGVFFVTDASVIRPRREPGIEIHEPLPPGSPVGVPRFDANPELLRVDSDGQGGTQLNLTTGQTLTPLTGVLDYGFRHYTLLPDLGSAPSISAAAAPDVASAALASEFTVASYNLQRFFDDVDAPGISDPILTSVALQSRLARASRQIRLNLGAPDIIGAVEVENLTTLQALAARISADGGPSYSAFLFEGNDIGGIDSGFLLKTAIVGGGLARVSNINVTQLGLSDTFVDPDDSSVDILNDRPPLLLNATVNAADGTATPVAVLLNHLRSLNGLEDATVRAKRQKQAEFVANLVQARQVANPSESLIVIGDFNAFEFNDGYVDLIGTIVGNPTPAANVVLASPDLVNPNLTRLVSASNYSYLFGGSIQSLDHVLVNQGLLGNTLARRVEHIRLNADFPELARNDALANARLSDHDPLIAYFQVASSNTPIISLSVTPSSINEIGAPTSATLTATLSGAAASNLTIPLNYSGSATLTTDFSAPASIVIPAGNLSANATISAVDDVAIEALETATISAAAGAGYTVGSAANLNIISEDGGNTAPSLSFSPVSGATISLSGGAAIGSVAAASVSVTPAGGAGSGSAATSTVNNCSITGGDAARFDSVTGVNLSFVGPVSTAQSLPISCTRGVSAASANLSCNVTIGAVAPSLVAFALICPAASGGSDLISISQAGAIYSQNFDSLRSGSFQSALPQGWRFSETGTNADSTYAGSSGSDNAGNTYAYGPGSCDRAFGTYLTGSVTSRIGACFVNNTGQTVNTLRIAYTGEHWRRGNLGPASDFLEFQYLVNPAVPGVADGTGTWIDANALDFTNPVVSGTLNSAVDGNASANRALRASDLTGLAVAPGESFCLRWLDTDMAIGVDHGLAVDDFTLIPEPSPAPGACNGLCVSDVSITEGNAGTSLANFNITLTSPAPVGGVLFDVRTAVETASNFDSDYVSLLQNDVLIAAGASSATISVQVNGDVRAEPTERFRLSVSNVRGSPVGDAIGVGTIVTDDAFELWQVQSSADRTPLDGLTITTQQNVVTALRSNGFFMQTPAARSDGDAKTSDALFVFTGGAPTVALNDLVNVSGTAAERFCGTQISATGASSVSVTGTSPAPIAPVQFNATRPSPNLGAPSCTAHPDPEIANFECFEHMLVEVQNGFVQGGNQRFPGLFSPPGIPGAAGDSDVFAEPLVTAGAARVLRGAGFAYPGFNATLPYPDFNAGDPAQVARITQVPIWGGAPQVFELDPDAFNTTANQVLYGGQRFNAVGVLTYEFDDFELWPQVLNVTPSPYPSTLPAAASGELTIASLNLLRYYGNNGTNIDITRCDGTFIDSYDAYSTSSASGLAEVVRRRNKLARYILDVLRAPDVLAVQEAENLAILQTLASELNTRDPSLGYSAYLVLGNDRSGINPGYLVRDGAGGAAARLSGVTVDQLGYNERLISDNSCLHDRPPLRLRATYVPSASAFTVINNHTRSLLGAHEANASGARTRAKRFQQSTSIRAFVDAELAAFPARPLVVLGDHNAYQFSDGLVDSIGIIRGIARPALIASPPELPAALQLSNAVDLIDPQQRYSYLFDNAAQALDHAMLNNAAQSVYSGFAYARNNVDAPAHMFALGEGACANVDIQPGATVQPATVGSSGCTEGLSDHEGFVLRLFGSAPKVSVVASASQIEGNAGTTTVSVNVSLTGSFPSGVSILRVPYRIVGGSALENIDYSVAAPGAFADLTATLNPRAFSIIINGDTLIEADETIEIELGQPIDFATGLPAPVLLSPSARRVQVTIVNDDALTNVVPQLVGRADRNATGGDFVSQNLTGSAREFRYVLEVPSDLASVNVELFDADFGAGGVSDPADIAGAASFNAGSVVSYQIESPSGTLLASLNGSTSLPVGANAAWISMLQMAAPSPGRYLLRVSVPASVIDSNGYRVRARGLANTRGGGNSTELSIYADGYASLGHPASGVVGTTSDVFYPYVTEGCSLRTRSFDFDAGSTSTSSIGLSAPNGYTQLFNNAQLSDDGLWNTLETAPFGSAINANGYGIWSASVAIEGGGGTANQGTLYFASTQGLAGTSSPSSNPAPASFRIYQAENGGAPSKPSVRQQLFAVSGANPPSPGNPGLYRMSIAVSNPGSAPIRFDGSVNLVRSLVPFSGGVRYQGGAQPSQGAIVSEPALGGSGEVLWNPGLVAAGDTVQLTYLIEVNPTLAGVTPVTGTYSASNGTTARYLDATNASSQFGPLCELALDSAGTALSTPITLASLASVRMAERVEIDFSVATQVGVAGYQVFEGSGDLRTPVGELLAASGDSLTPVRLKMSAQFSSASFYLQVLNIDSTIQWFGPFAVGASEGSMPDLPAIDWPALRLEADTSSQRQASQISADLAKARLRINRAGPVKLDATALFKVAPNLRGLALAGLQLREGSVQVPFEVQSQDSLFNEGDTLWFFATDMANEHGRSAAEYLYGDARTYVIEPGAGRLIRPVSGGFDGAVASSYLRRETIERQTQYVFSSPAADPFAGERLLARAGSPAKAAYQFALPDRTGSSVAILAQLWGGADFAAVDDHHAQLKIGAQTLAAQRFDGINAAQLRGNANIALGQALSLDVVIPGDNSQRFDLVHVDKVSVDYAAALKAGPEGWLQLKHASLIASQVDGFSSGFESAAVNSITLVARVAGLNADASAWWMSSGLPVRLASRAAPNATTDIALPINAQPGDDLLVFNGASAISPQILPWLMQAHLSAGSADYLIVAHPQFVDRMAPFVAAKQAQGLQVKIASTEAIYQRYGTGSPSAKAIADYVRIAKVQLGTRFVLLVGGDSYDPRNYLGAGSLSFVPTPYVNLHPLVRFGASDSAYADTNGDLLPDLAIGRWPVRSAAELEAVMLKSLKPGTNKRALMLADNQDVADAFSFKNASDQVITALSPSSVTTAYLDSLSTAQARAVLLARVNANDRLIHYFGHSGPTTWSYPAPGILSASDIYSGALGNSQPNILVQWGCWNSYHVIPQYNTLAHAWLLGPNGAQAVIGAAALTDAANDALLAKAFGSALLSSPTIGEALMQAKRQLGTTRPSAMDVLLGTTLLGDPALQY